jgi:hypothetical protein
VEEQTVAEKFGGFTVPVATTRQILFSREQTADN